MRTEFSEEPKKPTPQLEGSLKKKKKKKKKIVLRAAQVLESRRGDTVCLFVCLLVRGVGGAFQSREENREAGFSIIRPATDRPAQADCVCDYRRLN